MTLLVLTTLAASTPPTDASGDAPQSMAQMMAPFIMVLGIVMIAFILVISIRGKIARKNAARPDPREAIAEARLRAETKNTLDVQKAELLETTQDLASRLATRSRQLEILIDEADQRIASLKTLGAGQTMPKATPSLPLAISEAPVESKPPDPPDPEQLSIPQPRSTAPAVPLDSLTESVYTLSDAGCNPIEIAGKLDEQVGKVELILALRRSG